MLTRQQKDKIVDASTKGCMHMNDTEKKSIGFYVGYLARSAHRYFEQEFSKHGLNRGALFILTQLYLKDGMKQNELCANIHLDKAAVTRTIEKLENAGFVIRQSHPTDARAKLIFLTEKAMDFEMKFSKIFQNWSSILTADFSNLEKDMLMDFLKRMSNNTDDHFLTERL